MFQSVLIEQKMFYEERIAQLIQERDEARREVCNLQPFAYHNDGIAKDYASYRKWDCFKEDTDDGKSQTTD